MPEQFDPAWEYRIDDEEIAEILKEDAQYQNTNDQNYINGFRIGRPNSGTLNLTFGVDVYSSSKELFDVYCLKCNHKFKPRHEKNVFCSNACFGNSRLVSYKKACARQECLTTFATSRENRKYCSALCAKNSILLQRFNPSGEERRQCDGKLKGETFVDRERKCSKCGKDFTAKRAEQKQCGRSCNGASYRKLEQRQCSHCNMLFQPKRSDRRFCSRKCSRIYVLKSRRLDAKDLVPLIRYE